MHVYLRKCSPGRNLLGIGNEIVMGMQKPPSRKGSTQPNRKANRYRTFVALACAVLFSPSLLAATLTATLDRDTITLGERATLSLTFSGATPQSVPTPEVAGLQIDYVGQSSHVNIVQNQISSSVSHSFYVTPHQAGDFVIPAITADVGGEKLTTQPIRIKVLKPGAPSAEAINSGSQLAFLKLSLPKKEVYVGETILIELDLYLHGNVRSISGFQISAFPADGCSLGKMVQRDQRTSQLGNTAYTVIPLFYTLKPLKAGTLNLGPISASVIVEIPSGRRRRDPFFEQFGMRDPFGMLGGEQKQVTLATEVEPLQSMALPQQNVPAGFNGAVGTFTLNFSAGPTNVAVGDPITVRVQLSGRGAFDTLALPEQTAWQDFKTYPPTAKVDTTGDPMGIQGSKTFEQVIVPQKAEIKELPPISFSFFDPEGKTYRTLTEPATKLVVRPSGVAPAPTIASANRSQQQEIPPPAQDIVPIKTRWGTLAQAGPLLVRRPWFLALQGVPALALLSAVVLRRRAENYANNPRLRRQRQVGQLIRDGLQELARLAAQNKSDEFFATLFRLLQEQLGERLDLPASSITEAVIEEHLRPKRVSETILVPLQELFQTCNLARYAPVKSSEELVKLIPRFEITLGHLQRLEL